MNSSDIVYIILFPLLKPHWNHSNISCSLTLWWGSKSICNCHLPRPVHHPRLPVMFFFSRNNSPSFSWHCSHDSSLITLLFQCIILKEPPHSPVLFYESFRRLLSCIPFHLSSFYPRPRFKFNYELPISCAYPSQHPNLSLFPHTDASLSAQPQHRQHIGLIYSTIASVSFPLLQVLNLTKLWSSTGPINRKEPAAEILATSITSLRYPPSSWNFITWPQKLTPKIVK